MLLPPYSFKTSYTLPLANHGAAERHAIIAKNRAHFADCGDRADQGFNKLLLRNAGIQRLRNLR